MKEGTEVGGIARLLVPRQVGREGGLFAVFFTSECMLHGARDAESQTLFKEGTP